ncbi:hypothetical protein E2C01_083956 [Portunus trituberculatus]|uniref:Uncharacterized protein n=1 Tax=Portunus trituberculatus TaxID=210409 RepID=A0A5B7J7X4_PORTR|nr:hypothetical protein [Portunus trituberculatus]
MSGRSDSSGSATHWTSRTVIGMKNGSVIKQSRCHLLFTQSNGIPSLMYHVVNYLLIQPRKDLVSFHEKGNTSNCGNSINSPRLVPLTRPSQSRQTTITPSTLHFMEIAIKVVGRAMQT